MSMVSLRRLCDFLNSDEIAHENVQLGSRISLDNATVTWHSRGPVSGEATNREPFKLKDMNLQIPDEAKFVLVCGATGSGKVSKADSRTNIVADCACLDIISAESLGRGKVAERFNYGTEI